MSDKAADTCTDLLVTAEILLMQRTAKRLAALNILYLTQAHTSIYAPAEHEEETP